MHGQSLQFEINPPQPLHGAETVLQVVSFKIGDEEFGVDILRVQEIIRLKDLTRVPNSLDFVEGVINLRGRVVPVIALRKRFGMPELAHDQETRIVVLEIQHMVLGFIVDSVSEVLRIPARTVSPPPRLATTDQELVSGVSMIEDRLLILLDVEQIMGVPEVRMAGRPEARPDKHA